MRAGERGHHLAPNGRLAQTERRRAQIQDHFGALLDQRADRLDVVKRARQVVLRPDIFADGDADFPRAEQQRRHTPRAGSK